MLDLSKLLHDYQKADEQWVDDLISFFKPYFNNEEDAIDFIYKCLQSPSKAPKRALHQLYRFMSLSEELEQLKTGSVKDGFQIFCWIVAIEAIAKATTLVLQKKRLR